MTIFILLDCVDIYPGRDSGEAEWFLIKIANRSNISKEIFFVQTGLS